MTTGENRTNSKPAPSDDMNLGGVIGWILCVGIVLFVCLVVLQEGFTLRLGKAVLLASLAGGYFGNLIGKQFARKQPEAAAVEQVAQD